MGVIACVDLDPFLVGLIRRIRTTDIVIPVSPDEVLARRIRPFSAVVMAAGSDAVDRIAPSPLAERTILITGEQGPRVPPTHPGPTLWRPVDVSELRVALGQVAPLGRFAALRQRIRDLPVPATTDGLFSVARVSAVTAAAGLAFTSSGDPPVVALLAMFVWTLTRLWVRSTTVGLVAVDVLLAAGAVMATSGTGSPFLLFVAVVAAEVGYAFLAGSSFVVVSGATVAGLVPLVTGLSRGTTTPTDVVGWVTLLPLSTFIGVLARRIHSTRHTDNLQLLKQVHATLERLSKQAQGVAGTLDTTSVVDQVMATLREDLSARAGLLLIGDEEVHTVAGAFGLPNEAPARVVVPLPRGRRVPSELEPLLPDGEAMCARVDFVGASRGLLVAVMSPGAATRERQETLELLAAEAAVALENARLFEGIRHLTVDEERRRLARDLHDGVVQSLVHVRFELDLVRRLVDDPFTDELERLRGVVGQAVDEVRATVNDLRSVRLSAGLGTALWSLAREYERPGLRVVSDAGPVDALSPEAELQLLRIAQEAVSNAVHHGKAEVVYVRLWQSERHVHLQVLDDGVGIDGDVAEAGRGVGLRAMQERADLLGATLDLGPGVDGGTCVQVDVPVERTES